MPKYLDYIIIDDNEVDIFIATKMIESTIPAARVISFVYAVDALKMINNAKTKDTRTVLLVDINMPIINGFQFMEEFEKLPATVQDSYIPCFLTSSINESDIALARTFKSIRQYINKPLSSSIIEDVIASIH
jgi:CheY-like chemotaxis protein